MRKIKGLTFIELLVSILVITLSLVLLYTFSSKIASDSIENERNTSAFYNNISALDIIEKALDETGNITEAIEAAYLELNSCPNKFRQELEIRVEEIIFYSPDIDILKIDPSAIPVDEDNDGKTDYYRNENVLYFKVQTKNNAMSVSQFLPLYRITINTSIQGESRARNEIRALITPNKGRMNYVVGREVIP